MTWSKPHMRMSLGLWTVSEHRYVLEPVFLAPTFDYAADVARWLNNPKEADRGH